MGDEIRTPRSHSQREDRRERDPQDIQKAREVVADLRDAHAEVMRRAGAIYMTVGRGSRSSGSELARAYDAALQRFRDSLGDAVMFFGRPMYDASRRRWQRADAENVVERVWETLVEEATYRPMDFQETLARIHDHVNPIGYMALCARNKSPITSSARARAKKPTRTVPLPSDGVLRGPDSAQGISEEQDHHWAPTAVGRAMLDVGAEDIRGTQNPERYRGRLRRCVEFVCKQCFDVESVDLADLFGMEAVTVRGDVLRFGNMLRKRFQ